MSNQSAYPLSWPQSWPRAKSMEVHPDRPGGSHEAQVLINAAWDQARAAFTR